MKRHIISTHSVPYEDVKPRELSSRQRHKYAAFMINFSNFSKVLFQWDGRGNTSSFSIYFAVECISSFEVGFEPNLS